jgi:hypothetical protein
MHPKSAPPPRPTCTPQSPPHPRPTCTPQTRPPLPPPSHPHPPPPPPPTRTPSHFLSREEEYVGGLRAAVGIWRKVREEGLTLEDGLMMRQLVDWPGGLELHLGVRRAVAGAGV